MAPFRDVFDTYELLAYLPIRAGQLGIPTGEVPVRRSYPDDGAIPTKIHGISGNLAPPADPRPTRPPDVTPQPPLRCRRRSAIAATRHNALARDQTDGTLPPRGRCSRHHRLRHLPPLRWLGAPLMLANAAAFTLAFLIGFTINRHWTFDAAQGHRRRQLARYGAVALAGLVLNTAVLTGLVALDTPEIPAKAAATIASAALNFTLSRSWVFSRTASAAPDPEVTAGGAPRPCAEVTRSRDSQLVSDRFVQALAWGTSIFRVRGPEPRAKDG